MCELMKEGRAAGRRDSIVIVADEVSNPDRYTLIDENLTISRSMNLSVAAGIDAVLAPDRTIYVGLTADAAHTVRISDLNLRRGAIRVDPATGAVTLDGEPVTAPPADDVPLSTRYLLG